MSADFPLIYCNGDSYSAETYHPSLLNKVYANVVANFCNGFVINKSISGSCNRRIVRTTVHDVLKERQINPDQQIIVLLGLSFELRSELWIDDLVSHCAEESNLRTHTFSSQQTWRENLLNGNDIDTKNNYKLNTKFYNEYSRGRAYFFSPYSERINLLTDLVMLRSLFESLNIDFLIFQSPRAEKLQKDHLLDFFKTQLSNDDRFFDLEKFGFVNWCADNKFIPLDFHDRPTIGHYGEDAHAEFANQVIIPRLQKLNIL